MKAIRLVEVQRPLQMQDIPCPLSAQTMFWCAFIGAQVKRLIALLD